MYREMFLKEYYEIVEKPALYQDSVPTHADFFKQKYISSHETKQASEWSEL